MKFRILITCCVTLLCVLPIQAEEAELVLPEVASEEATVPIECPERSLESKEEVADWAGEIGAITDFGRVATGTLPPCPIPIPDCPGLVPIGCDPDTACQETSSCTTTDLGFKKCEIGGTTVSCPSNETFHTTRCDCNPTCAGAFCGSTRHVSCQ